MGHGQRQSHRYGEELTLAVFGCHSRLNLARYTMIFLQLQAMNEVCMRCVDTGGVRFDGFPERVTLTPFLTGRNPHR
jgi:hypothetical protein